MHQKTVVEKAMARERAEHSEARLAEAEDRLSIALSANHDLRDERNSLTDWRNEAEALLRTEQQWLRETFGERCSDYEPDCCGCQAWKQIDRIDAFLAKVKP